MTYSTFSCTESFRTVAVILVLTIIKNTNGFPTQPASGKIRQDEDYQFDIMYDWIDRNAMPTVSETEPFPSLPKVPGRFENEKNDLSSPFDIFDIETRGKEWKRIYEQLERYPVHTDLQITPVKRFDISKKHKICTGDVKLAPWARRLCNAHKRST